MKNRKLDRKTTKQIVIDKGLHKLVKVEATTAGKTIREFVEECLIEAFGLITDKK